MKIDWQTLNTEQLAAVRHTEGPLLLLAGAGSGKTRVITYRCAFLLGECGVPPENLLAVTFTNKAAREMQERVRELVGQKACKGMIISTFHSLGVRILRQDIEKLGYKKNFSIYGAADQIRLVRDKLQKIDTGGHKLDAEHILFLISAAKNRLLGPGEMSFRPGVPAEWAAAQVYPDYQSSLKAFNSIDFDDILMLTVRLLQQSPALLKRYQQRFRYIMVDEYQDTNHAQYQLLRLLCGGHGNICVVGDDDQSIYGWRGAEPQNILDFEKDFSGASVIKLEQNYRSTGHILAAANGLIRHNTKRKDKVLWTSGDKGPLVDYIRCEDSEDEARSVVERIHAERYKDQLSYRDFAILYRTNVQSRAFEEQLRYDNIPYVLIGGQQFFDRKEVKDTIAYLKVLVNPLDEVNLLRILNFPHRGIGDTSADRLIRTSAEQERPLWEVLQTPEEVEALGEKGCEAIQVFVAMLKKYRQRFRQGPLLTETLREFLAEVGIENELFRTAKDPQQGRRRVENVAEVVNAMASYVEREVQPALTGFLEKVSLLDQDEIGRDTKERKLARDAVVLMSLHSSKGLEFPHVFLVGMEDEYLPFRKNEAESGDVDEERRLCYVGITRARRKLTLLNAARRKKYGKLIPREPSRFLAEIPTDLLQEQVNGPAPLSSEVEQEQQASDFFSKMRAMLDD